MSKWSREELENMLEDVVNELDLSDGMIEEHGSLGTAPAELVRLILERKDIEIGLLKRGFMPANDINRWVDECKRLWSLLDDVSTAGDVFKPELNQYFKYVNHKCECRDGLLTSDGYSILIKQHTDTVDKESGDE